MTEAWIDGVTVLGVERHEDERGWLAELWRRDGLLPVPAMAYMSWTKPGVRRGPHEHRKQTDVFFFLGPSTFRVVLWDNRKDSTTSGRKLILHCGENKPMVMIVPPGVVHGYENVGQCMGLVVNLPDALYRGEKGMEDVDEIRHEMDPNSPFSM